MKKISRILFVCSANVDRSKTAEAYFSTLYNDLDFKSAGTNFELCRQEGSTPLTTDLIEWADMIFGMENQHLEKINALSENQFESKITVLNISDDFVYYQPELLELLEKRISPFIESAVSQD